MESLPHHLLYSVFQFIESPELFRSLVYVSKDFHGAISSHFFLQILIRRDLGVDRQIQISSASCREVILANILTRSSNDINFTAFFTDGGIIQSQDAFWISNIFHRGTPGYASVANSSLIIGVLQCTQPVLKDQYWAKEEVIKISKDWLRKKSMTLNRDNYHSAVMAFRYIFATFPIDAVAIDEEDIENFKLHVHEIRDALNAEPEYCRKYKKYPNDSLVYEMNVDIEAANSSNTLACFHGFNILKDRYGLARLLLFVSEVYVEPKDLEEFNFIGSIEQATAIFNDLNIKCQHTVHQNGYQYFEILTRSQKLKPILFVEIEDAEQTGNIHIDLTKIVSGAYVYVKLFGRNNQLEPSNTGCVYVIGEGNIINIKS